VGESVKAGGKMIEVVHFWITDAGRAALEES
jgi:putative SOS response-associated peptidase YedK